MDPNRRRIAQDDLFPGHGGIPSHGGVPSPRGSLIGPESFKTTHHRAAPRYDPIIPVSPLPFCIPTPRNPPLVGVGEPTHDHLRKPD